MNGTIADPHNPRLGIWQTLIKLSGSNHRVVRQFKSSSLNVNRHDFPMIAFLNLLTHLRLINLITTSSKLFFAIAGLSNYHRLDLVSTVPLYFSLGDRIVLYADAISPYRVNDLMRYIAAWLVCQSLCAVNTISYHTIVSK
jgi:hypothetical protein